MQRAPVFEETYQRYLAELGRVDYLERAGLLGVTVEDERLIIPLYNRRYAVSPAGIQTCNGPDATPAVRVILCKYVLHCEKEPEVAVPRLMSYREFKDAAPLVSYFATNTNKTLETHFSGKLGQLKLRAEQFGGVVEQNPAYDLSFRFHALPRIPVFVNFNDSDDLFPASCSVLYLDSARHFLDMECLAMTGTLLSGNLITSDSKSPSDS